MINRPKTMEYHGIGVSGAPWSVSGRLWGVLGRLWSTSGASWGVLRASWVVSGASWGATGASRGSILAPLGPLWPPFWHHFGGLGVPFGLPWRGVAKCPRNSSFLGRLWTSFWHQNQLKNLHLFQWKSDLFFIRFFNGFGTDFGMVFKTCF